MSAQYSTTEIVARVIKAINYCNTQIMNINEYYIIEAIFQHIKEDGYQFSTLSIAQLAEESNTSQASISRFVKKMGFHSFLDFRNSFSAALGTQYYRRIQRMITTFSKTTPEKIKEEQYNRIIENVNETYQNLDMVQMMKAVKWLKQARSVLIAGDTMTKSMFFTLQLDLMFSGTPAYIFLNQEMEEIQSQRLGNQDVLLLAGSVTEFVVEEQRDILRKCHEKGVRIIVILQDMDDEIKELYDMHIAYGIENGRQSGFHSLFYISRMFSDLLMLSEK